MNAPRKKKAGKIYTELAGKGLTHAEIMGKLKSNLDTNYSKEELEEIELYVAEEGLKVQAEGPVKPIAPQAVSAAGRAIQKAHPAPTGGNVHYEEWLCEVVWPRDKKTNEIPDDAVPKVTKMKRLRDRVVINEQTAGTLNHSHMAPSCNRPILYMLPGVELPEGYGD